MRISLRVEEGAGEGQVFTFDGHSNFIVGRSDRAHLQLPVKDKFFSRVHFMIEMNPPLCRLIDMGSTNGTLVNGHKVQAADLKDGDLIKAGVTVLRVHVVPGAAAIDDPDESPFLETLSIRRSADDLGADDDARATTVRPGPRPGESGTRTLPNMPARPAAAGSPNTCRVCSAALTVITVSDTVGLCAMCQDGIRSRAQTIPGYKIVRELGRGGMGIVYLALRIRDGSLVALKTIKPAIVGSDVEVKRFLREAEILGVLDHPHIVAFREMGEHGGEFHFAMDFIDGLDAARLQRQHGGPLPVGRAVGLVCQMLSALDYAHAKGFVHRDIKPANLLVARENGRDLVKMTDFGLARVYQSSKMSGLTMNGDLGGTVAFMAPEQITELRGARPTVDQYSASATLYKLLTDQFVHDLAGRLEQQISKVLLEEPVPILQRRADLPENLAAIVHRALAREPAARFKTAGDFRRALLPFAT